jgi:hypothetical protein
VLPGGAGRVGRGGPARGARQVGGRHHSRGGRRLVGPTRSRGGDPGALSGGPRGPAGGPRPAAAPATGSRAATCGPCEPVENPVENYCGKPRNSGGIGADRLSTMPTSCGVAIDRRAQHVVAWLAPFEEWTSVSEALRTPVSVDERKTSSFLHDPAPERGDRCEATRAAEREAQESRRLSGGAPAPARLRVAAPAVGPVRGRRLRGSEAVSPGAGRRRVEVASQPSRVLGSRTVRWDELEGSPAASAEEVVMPVEHEIAGVSGRNPR